ncbi:MAG: phospholipid carrier-dependent glycosyltransferase [Dehalococcoidia bacterium]|nr:phospholipid carrier-dependent glycosyltransferase [Dehalococcoidia bacterium]
MADSPQAPDLTLPENHAGPRPRPFAAAVARVRSSRLAWPAAIVAILLVAAGLRFHGLDWDQPEGANAPLQMHPDERFMSLVGDRIDWPSSVAEYFDTANSPLNPYNAPETPSFVYGTFPLFLAKAVSTIAGDDPEGPGSGYEQTVVWGRRLTALFDTLTVLVLFALGATLANRAVGGLAALLYALAVLPTQLAHFWTADPFLVFFSTLSLLGMARYVQARGPWKPWVYALATGVAIALAVACKVNAALLIPVFALAVAARIALRDLPVLGLAWKGTQPDPASRGSLRTGQWMTDGAAFCLALAAGLVVFRIVQPYAFSGPDFWDTGFNSYWLDDINRERDFQDGNVDYPPFVQFAGKTPVLEPLIQLVRWGLGPALGLTALAGTFAATALVFKRRELAFILPLAFIIAVMGFQGPRFVAFMRYFAPVYPALCLLAAWALVAVWKGRRRRAPLALPHPAAAVPWLRRHTPFRRHRATDAHLLAEAAGASPAPRRLHVPARALRLGATGLVVAVVAVTAWYALAFQNVYRETQPRIAASEWIYANLPWGTRITGEFWDDTIPYYLPGRDAARYVIVETEPYEPDSLAKVRTLVFGTPGAGPAKGGLDGADYVAITSSRIRTSVQELEREYPATIRYYELLESGELGFERVATFEVRPSFLGIPLDDSAAEESFTVYDHPEVRIYRKTDAWDPLRAVALLNEAHPERATNLLPKQGRTNGLQFRPDEWATQQAGGTFAAIFDADGWASSIPWLWWLLFLEVAAFATFPWVSWLFRALPDRGFGLSKLTGISSVALGTWMLVAWGGPHFSGTVAWSVFAAIAAFGGVVAAVRRRQLLAEARLRWPAWLAAEAIFLAVFTLFLAYRYANPDLWYHPQGGEKFVELAYLTAVAKSSTLPPYDPWFAGGTMNYYYMGWFFVAVPMRALHLLPEVAFNLGIPTFAALTAAVGFSTVHNLVALSPIHRPNAPALRARPRVAIIGGVFGVFLLVFAANLDSAHQAIERFQAINTWGGAWGTGGSSGWDIPVLGEPLRLAARMAGGAVGVAGGFYQWLVNDVPLRPFDWWRSSRAHPPQFDITEYPYWSLTFGDLHPHLMGLPFFGFVIALVAAYAVSVGRALRAQSWALAAALGIGLGLVRTVHTWDFPTAVLLVAGGIAATQLVAKGRWQTRTWLAAAHLVLAAGVLVVAFLPYTARFETFETGVVLARETTAANQQFAHFGLFLTVALLFLVVRTHEELARRNFLPGRNPAFAIVAGPWELGALAVFILGLSAFTWRFGLTTLALSVLALLFFANLLWLEIRSREPDIPRFLVTGMFVAALGISAGVDVVNVKNDIVRMNTVFKFGLQAWQLFALASAYATWYCGRALWTFRGWQPRPRAHHRLAAGVATATLALLVFGSSLYLYSGTRERQAARFLDTPNTLNGLVYFDHGQYYEDAGNTDPLDDSWITLADDKPLIDWLRANAKGSPVIVEAVGPVYHWNGRISASTGLPTVSGWDWHSIAYRMAYAHLVQQRQAEIQNFYRTPDTTFAADFIRKYDVRYVIVGTEERIHGTPAGIVKFQSMDGLTEVFRSGTFAIYETSAELRGPAPPTPPAPVTGPRIPSLRHGGRNSPNPR